MRNTIISRNALGRGEWQVVAELLPDTPIETAAIDQCAHYEANENEKELVDDYLLFGLTGLGNYSFVRPVSQRGRQFTIIVHLNRASGSSFG